MAEFKEPKFPVQILRQPGALPLAVMPLPLFLVLADLARLAAESNGEEDKVTRAAERALKDKSLDRLSAQTLSGAQYASQLRTYLLDSETFQRHVRGSLESLDIVELSNVFEPMGDEEAEDIAAYKDGMKSEEETFPLEVAKRLVAGDSPLKVFREYRGLTQAALAELTGISRLYLSQIETGRRGGSVKTLRALSKALDVELDNLAA